jgi:hypothetical protein
LLFGSLSLLGAPHANLIYLNRADDFPLKLLLWLSLQVTMVTSANDARIMTGRRECGRQKA